MFPTVDTAPVAYHRQVIEESMATTMMLAGLAALSLILSTTNGVTAILLILMLLRLLENCMIAMQMMG